MNDWSRPLGAAAALGLLVPTLVHPQGAGPVLCPFRRITGVWCPSCGMTRAMGWLARGDFDRALRLHPAAPAVAAEALIAAALWLFVRRRPHDPRAVRLRSSSRLVVPVALVANSLFLIVVWLIRLKTGAFDQLQ